MASCSKDVDINDEHDADEEQVEETVAAPMLAPQEKNTLRRFAVAEKNLASSKSAEKNLAPSKSTASVYSDEHDADDEQVEETVANSVPQEINTTRRFAVAAEEDDETQETSAARSNIMEVDDNNDDQAPLDEQMIEEDEEEALSTQQDKQELEARIAALQKEMKILTSQQASQKQKPLSQASKQPPNKKAPNKAPSQVSKQTKSK